MLTLEKRNNQLKAQYYLREEIREYFTDDVLESEMKKIYKKDIIAFPYYALDGKVVNARSLYQVFITPNNEEYPYDPDGKRTGIIFGLIKKDLENPFGIGRLEAQGTDSSQTVLLNEDDVEKQKELLVLVKETISHLSNTIRADFLAIYSNLIPLTQEENQELLREVFHTYISEENKEDILSIFYQEKGQKEYIEDVLLPVFADRYKKAYHKITRSYEDIPIQNFSTFANEFHYDYVTANDLLAVEKLFDIDVSDEKYLGATGREIKEAKDGAELMLMLIVLKVLESIKKEHDKLLNADSKESFKNDAAFAEYMHYVQNYMDLAEVYSEVRVAEMNEWSLKLKEVYEKNKQTQGS